MIGLEEQLQFVRVVQEFRGPFVDVFFRFLNFFDSGEYFSALNAFIWIGLSWRWGARLGYLFIVNGIINHLMKGAFEMPRPFFLDPTLAMVKAGSYGFPSGAAQMSMLLAGLLIYAWKSPWAWPSATLYLLLISFSRIFLGVHFPIDLLGGWVLGLLLLGAFVLCAPPIEKFAAKQPNTALITTLLLFCFLFAVLPSNNYYLLNIGILISLGISISRRYGLYISGRRKLGVKIFHGMVAVGGSFLLGFGFVHLFDIEVSMVRRIYTFMGAIWVSLLASPFCKRATP
jgi:membrane-associated phospholipid phosphatase